MCQTLCESVVDVIRMKMFNHGLAPGMRITEQDISDELGVSRGPIREALRRLEQEGLVGCARSVGCLVKNVTLKDIYETCLLRATYEVSAVKLCRGMFSKTALAEMDATLESMRDLEETDYNKPTAYNNILHETIIRSINLPRPIKGWADLSYGNAIDYYAGNSDSQVMIERQCPIHEELVDVCRIGNMEEICRTMSSHHMETVRRWLKEQGTPESHFKFSIDVIGGWV